MIGKFFPTRNKLLAVLEVLLLIFVFVPFLTLGIYHFLPGFESWQIETLGFPFPVFSHVVMVGLSLLFIAIRRKKLTDYGITFQNPKYHLDIVGVCFIPVLLAGTPLGMGVDHTTWNGAFILAALQIVLLLIIGLILRKKTTYPGVGLSVGAILLFPLTGTAEGIAGKAIVFFLTYALFVGFGEEILYRGYMQSRLNEVFGKPYHFFGVAFGWGTILTALFFGFTHVGILSYVLGLSTNITLAWGFWTFFGGLVFGFVREKSDSILAPALLHGLPQAIAEVTALFFF